MKQSEKRPFFTWLLVILLVFIGIGAIISGAMLFSAPDGHLMQWNTDQLAGTPFSNYLIPGLVLFTFLGVYPLFVSYGLLKKPNWKWIERFNPMNEQHWAWTASWVAGIIMVVWIAVETALLGLISFLQPVIAVYGIIVILLTLTPRVKRHLRRNRSVR